MLTTSIVNVCVVFDPSVFCIYDEREWSTAYGTPNWVFVYFNSVIKRVKRCCCTLILLPKSTLKANLTTTNPFFANDDWQRGRFENFESDHQYESNLESDVRFEIESNHEAPQVPSFTNTYLLTSVWALPPDQHRIPGRQYLRSARRDQLCLGIIWKPIGGHSFVCAAASAWNSLPDSLKDTALSLCRFQNHLKTFLSLVTHWGVRRRCRAYAL